ncbi:hypothetical protein CASFOL_037291 [Castilleja foliolosa]|uniref:DUF8039 domain-containing protein n=1 Tax=Castilleja foliolosa TaxID=1961234 RepID=A0ABD3BNQ8_9LAMI
MDDDQVRVTVEEVLVADALVPIPTEEVTTVGEASGQFIAWPRRLVVENVRQVNPQRELFPKQSSQVNPEPATPLTKTDVLKTLWFAAADIKKPRKLYIEPGVVGLTRISLAINQLDIMGLLVTGTISVSVMTFYNKCLYNILKSSRRDARYGLMCLLTIQTHCNNEDMSLIRNRIGEGSFDFFLLPLYEVGN